MTSRSERELAATEPYELVRDREQGRRCELGIEAECAGTGVVTDQLEPRRTFDGARAERERERGRGVRVEQDRDRQELELVGVEATRGERGEQLVVDRDLDRQGRADDVERGAHGRRERRADLRGRRRLCERDDLAERFVRFGGRLANVGD